MLFPRCAGYDREVAIKAHVYHETGLQLERQSRAVKTTGEFVAYAGGNNLARVEAGALGMFPTPDRLPVPAVREGSGQRVDDGLLIAGCEIPHGERRLIGSHWRYPCTLFCDRLVRHGVSAPVKRSVCTSYFL